MSFDQPFTERLFARIKKYSSRLVVGLDPVLERFPAELQSLEIEQALVSFCETVVDQVGDQVAAIKPQIAYFERHGWRGWRAFDHIVRAIHERGIPIIVDAKRGDIGSTAQAYCDGFFGDDEHCFGSCIDALTVNPYLGTDSLQPFIDRAQQAHRGLFVLARTSNAGGAEFQARKTDGEPLFLAVAKAAEKWNGAGEGYGPVGLVAGATFPEELLQIREAAPRSYLLLPGLGAQGATAEQLRVAWDSAGHGALASSSRGILYAYEKQPKISWPKAVAEAAQAQRLAIERVIAGC